MSRNPGATIDTERQQILDRDGLWSPMVDLAVTEHGLYYHRPIEGFDPFWHQERWVLPGPGWVVNRFTFRAHREDAVDWSIETEIIERDGHTWRIRDAYLDVFVHEGARYHLDDAGELADGIAGGEIALAEGLTALRALDALCMALRANGCSGHALLREFAPSLPASMIVRDSAGVFNLAGSDP